MEFTKIKTVEDAFAATGRDFSKQPDFSMLTPEEARHYLNNFHLKVVVEAINLNEDGTKWLPDYREGSDYKYNPYFWIDANDEQPGGFGFSGSGCVLWYTHSAAGSRLCFKSKDRWKYCVEQFKSLWVEEFIILK